MIQQQLDLTFAMIIMGILLTLGYDILLIGREVFRRSRVLIVLEDLLYWTIGAVCTFSVIYNINEGIIRGYAIAGLAGSAILFQWAIGHRVVIRLVTLMSKCRKGLINVFYRCKIKKKIKKG